MYKYAMFKFTVYEVLGGVMEATALGKKLFLSLFVCARIALYRFPDELNMSRSSGTGSSQSLSSTSTGGEAPHGEDGPVNKVVSWAVGFEHLLADPVGVNYFTAFLQSEVSAENILFWQACEKFQKIPPTNLDELKKEAHAIYELYLSDNSFHAINIDDTARTNESDLDKPTPDMFSKAQQQIFKLMKFDSYARFVRSPLYRSCTLASVEGHPLPMLDSQKCLTPTNDRKSTDIKGLASDSKTNRKKKLEKRGSWGADGTYRKSTGARPESLMSVKSNSSLELGSTFGRSENSSSSPTGSEPDSSVRADKYCCVYLPDGTASLAPARPGLPLHDMLSGLCEKRGFPMKDIIIYFHGKDKNVCPRQQPLSLDQDSSILQDQQVSLELRVTFMLEIVFTEKTVAIVAKSSKTLGDALSSVLQKQQLRPQDVHVTMSESKEPINMNTSVFALANKTVCLDKVKCPSGGELKNTPAGDRGRMSNKTKRTNEMDGLVEMLTRVQCSRADDQRGLLTKEQLQLPQFLQLPTQSESGEAKANNVQDSCSNLRLPAGAAGVNEGGNCLGLNGDHKDSNKERNPKRT
ncbi:regulator of G-protein signaling 14a [Trichomycterus rosablanca]|uniref:regulator of G-protein signaling 14a n=1 Tax=Trichomycterus rosablanca TaxID=2290929 RepID=UPI002F356237